MSSTSTRPRCWRRPAVVSIRSVRSLTATTAPTHSPMAGMHSPADLPDPGAPSAITDVPSRRATQWSRCWPSTRRLPSGPAVSSPARPRPRTDAHRERRTGWDRNGKNAGRPPRRTTSPNRRAASSGTVTNTTTAQKTTLERTVVAPTHCQGRMPPRLWTRLRIATYGHSTTCVWGAPPASVAASAKIRPGTTQSTASVT